MNEDYVVGHLGSGAFTVAKFGMGSPPQTVYHVRLNMASRRTGYLTCDCPGGMHSNCKHRTMVQYYMEAGYPILNCFWMSEGKIHAYYQNVTPEWKRELERVTGHGRGAPKVGKRGTRSKRVAAPEQRRQRVPNKRTHR